MSTLQRNPSSRLWSDVRPITIETGVNRYAEGSAIIRCGNTHVLCTASVDESLPKWIKDKKHGWVSAEYSMLPRSTHTRSNRDREKVSGRTQEIQRLIARSLRTCVKLEGLGERTITLDCDVLQADGGTRTASITGACVALIIALDKLIRDKKIKPECFVDYVAAVSLGLRKEQILVDLDYEEDSSVDVDMNFVKAEKRGWVEIQGTAEKSPFQQSELVGMTAAADLALARLNQAQREAVKAAGVTSSVFYG
jgi:ribonuclease PH